MKTFHDGKITLHAGDCLDVLKALPENSIDAVVTDPPYHLTSIVKRFGSANAAPAKGNDAFIRASKGFMGKQWDGGDIAFRPELWAEVLRVLKPGGHMVAFSGTRTYHRMAVAIEDAGFEIREMLSYCYGSGFPKSHNVSHNLDEVRCGCGSDREKAEHDLRRVRERHVSSSLHACGREGEVLLKGVPQQNTSHSVLREESREGGEGTEERGMEGRGDVSQETRELRQRSVYQMPAQSDFNGKAGRLCDGASAGDGEAFGERTIANGMCPSPRSQSAEQRSDESGIVALQSQPQERGAWPRCEQCGKPIIPDGLGTALKPAHEPICLARKPLSEGTIAANVLRWGTGALNIDKCRIFSPSSPQVAVSASERLSRLGSLLDTASVDPDCGLDIVRRIAFELQACSNGDKDRQHNGADLNGIVQEDDQADETLLCRLLANASSYEADWWSVLNSQADCRPLSRFGDGRLRAILEAAQDGIASLGDALSRMCKEQFEPTHIHDHQNSAHPSTSDDLGLAVSLCQILVAVAKKNTTGYSAPQQGRWPANLIHDNSPEVLAGFPETKSTRSEVTSKPGGIYGMGAGLPSHTGVYGFDDSGSAARFFYTAKANADDRLNSKHPTVKPVDLIQWLVRLVCPKGSTVLDMFAGTGTTGAAAFIEGRRCVLIEREAEYLADIEKRMGMLLSGSEERSWKLAKPEPLEALPLFALPEPAE